MNGVRLQAAGCTMWSLFRRRSRVVALEQRRAARIALVVPATLQLPNGSQVECMTVDISATGARLSIRSPTALPGGFDLCLPGSSFVPCRVVWRNEDVFGVEFV